MILYFIPLLSSVSVTSVGSVAHLLAVSLLFMLLVPTLMRCKVVGGVGVALACDILLLRGRIVACFLSPCMRGSLSYWNLH